MRNLLPNKIGLTLIIVLASLAARVSHAQSLVFADVLNPNDPAGNSIRSVKTDGTGLQTLIQTGGGVRGVDVDPIAGFIYWTDTDHFVIRRAHLDGSGQQDLIASGLGFPSALRLDLAAGKMYWGDQTNNEIRRANLDGSVPETTTPTPFFRGIAIDHANSLIYWSTADTAPTGRILRANLDGTSPQVVVSSTASPFKAGNIALDVSGGKIYWTDAINRVVRRANLDGMGMEDLFVAPFVGSPKGIAIDFPNAKVYWGQEVVDFDSGALIDGQIRRMNLDGSVPEIVVSGLGSVNDLAVVPCAADFTRDGHLTVQDIFDFLTAWFASDPRADFNHVNGITVQDIFDFLAAWFAGCP